jgi:hypothetical protein
VLLFRPVTCILGGHNFPFFTCQACSGFGNFVIDRILIKYKKFRINNTAKKQESIYKFENCITLPIQKSFFPLLQYANMYSACTPFDFFVSFSIYLPGTVPLLVFVFLLNFYIVHYLFFGFIPNILGCYFFLKCIPYEMN